MVNCLESFKPRSFVIRPVWTQAQGNTTAAAKTGPARGPQPASSAPATTVNPFCHNSDSCASRCQYFAAIFRTLGRSNPLDKRNRLLQRVGRGSPLRAAHATARRAEDCRALPAMSEVLFLSPRRQSRIESVHFNITRSQTLPIIIELHIGMIR